MAVISKENCTKVTPKELEELASEVRESVWEQARGVGREPKIYMHWTAGKYDTLFDDYHVCITGDGSIYITGALDEPLAHTWRRNTGSIGITLCAAYNATTDDLGDYAPTAAQIESMAQAVCAVADGLWLTINSNYVLTHGEAADSIDGIYTWDENDCYGPQHTVERWDLQFLGTAESPKYTTDYDDPSTGGNVLRGKAQWYREQKG